jgi:hypothetical protein
MINRKDVMRRFLALLAGCLLLAAAAVAEDPSPADQKWLAAVEKMAARGQTRVSTPSESRAQLLQQWAGKNGYSAKVEKTDNGYSIEVTKGLARN